MAKVVFILGAGASAHAKAPLMRDFIDRARDIFANGDAGQHVLSYETAFRAIGELGIVQSKADIDFSNIELVFSALDMSRILGVLPGFKDSEIEGVVNSLKMMMVSTIEQSMNFPLSFPIVSPHNLYQQLAEKIDRLARLSRPPHDSAVITFNYDIGLDVALLHAKRFVSYGLPAEVRPPEAIDLLKLHGSINWAAKKDDGSVHALNLSEYYPTLQPLWMSQGNPPLTTLPVGSDLARAFKSLRRMDVRSDPVIVPPSWNKGEHHRVLSSVWARAAAHLREAEYIFVIGYSLPETDSFFRLLYGLGTAGTSVLRAFHVFDVDNTGQVENRFRQLLGPGAKSRYRYFDGGFQGALNHLQSLFST